MNNRQSAIKIEVEASPLNDAINNLCATSRAISGYAEPLFAACRYDLDKLVKCRMVPLPGTSTCKVILEPSDLLRTFLETSDAADNKSLKEQQSSSIGDSLFLSFREGFSAVQSTKGLLI
jgi:hypothetical protein